jgi:hypothetical protein
MMTLEGPENSASPVNNAPVSIRHTEIDPILLHERFIPAQTDSAVCCLSALSICTSHTSGRNEAFDELHISAVSAPRIGSKTPPGRGPWDRRRRGMGRTGGQRQETPSGNTVQ